MNLTIFVFFLLVIPTLATVRLSVDETLTTTHHSLDEMVEWEYNDAMKEIEKKAKMEIEMVQHNEKMKIRAIENKKMKMKALKDKATKKLAPANHQEIKSRSGSYDYTKKYTEKWPNCENLLCMCGTKTRFTSTCNQLGCSGFSFPTGVNGPDGVGCGCLKNCGNDDSFAGYGYGTHDYWENTATFAPTVTNLPVSFGYTKKYFEIWPHCENVEKCMCGTQEGFAERCNSFDNCAGFSFTTGVNDDGGNGCGCLKNCGNDDSFAGYGYGTHDYWEKSTATIAPSNAPISPNYSPVVSPNYVPEPSLPNASKAPIVFDTPISTPVADLEPPVADLDKI